MYGIQTLLPVGLLAQLVERYTSIAEDKGLNPVQAWIAFFLQLQKLHLQTAMTNAFLMVNSSVFFFLNIYSIIFYT